MGLIWSGICALFLACPAGAFAAQSAEVSKIDFLSTREVSLSVAGNASGLYRLQTSTNLAEWQNWSTILLPVSGTMQQTDSAAPFVVQRFFRMEQPEETNLLTGDDFPVEGGEIIIHPVNHASFVLQWNELMIYNDPVGGAAAYKTFRRPDLILISHDHGDHFDQSTLSGVRTASTVIVAPRAVYNALSATLKAQTVVLTNGASANLLGIQIDAVPAYNSNHPKGTGNGYVLTLGGKRIYMSGDTGNTAEIRALTGIDIAFVCMNVPYTMSIPDALSAVRAFRPGVVYPYHFRNSDNSLTDLNSFKRQLGTQPGVEVRIRKWY